MPWPVCLRQYFYGRDKNVYLSRDMTKPTKWVCAQRRLRSAWASAQSVFAVRMKEAWVLGHPLSAQRRLWSDHSEDGCPVWSESSLAHTHFVGFVMSRLICALSCVWIWDSAQYTAIWLIGKSPLFLRRLKMESGPNCYRLYVHLDHLVPLTCVPRILLFHLSVTLGKEQNSFRA